MDAVTNPTARTFRAFAEFDAERSEGAGRAHRGSRDPIAPEALRALACPVLVAVGSDDVISGSASDLAAIIPGAEALVIEGRDHMKSVGDRSYKDGVVAFLRRRP